MALFGRLPSARVRREHSEQKEALEATLLRLTKDYKSARWATRRFDIPPLLLVAVQLGILALSVVACIAPPEWVRELIFVAWLVATFSWSQIQFLRRRVRWVSRQPIWALLLILPAAAIHFSDVWYPRMIVPESPDWMGLTWASAAFAFFILLVALRRKLYLESEVEQTRIACVASKVSNRLKKHIAHYEQRYATVTSWLRLAKTVGAMLLVRELAQSIMSASPSSDAAFGGAESQMPLGIDASLPSSDGSMVDLNSDGIMDTTSSGTPVTWIRSYMRGGDIVAGHYRTIADGLLWNNLGSS